MEYDVSVDAINTESNAISNTFQEFHPRSILHIQPLPVKIFIYISLYVILRLG